MDGLTEDLFDLLLIPKLEFILNIKVNIIMDGMERWRWEKPW